MHVIDEMSPLFGVTQEQLLDDDIAIIVVMTGTDESFSQPVYARHTYSARDLVWNRQFADIIGVTQSGVASIDYRKFHEVEDPLPAADVEGLDV
jgi:inward rectifier potassium channel